MGWDEGMEIPERPTPADDYDFRAMGNQLKQG
jgi:hypothetical protein